MGKKKTPFINGEKANTLIAMLPPSVTVLRWEVKNSWLVVMLDSGVEVKIRNK